MPVTYHDMSAKSDIDVAFQRLVDLAELSRPARQILWRADSRLDATGNAIMQKGADGTVDWSSAPIGMLRFVASIGGNAVYAYPFGATGAAAAGGAGTLQLPHPINDSCGMAMSVRPTAAPSSNYISSLLICDSGNGTFNRIDIGQIYSVSPTNWAVWSGANTGPAALDTGVAADAATTRTILLYKASSRLHVNIDGNYCGSLALPATWTGTKPMYLFFSTAPSKGLYASWLQVATSG
jgi:hypothetical protein